MNGLLWTCITFWFGMAAGAAFLFVNGVVCL